MAKKAILFSACLCITSVAYAAPYFIVAAASGDNAFPTEMYPESQAAGSFIVTNNYAATKTAYFTSLAADYVLLPTDGALAPPCGTTGFITLAAGASCELRVGFLSGYTATGSVTLTLPTVCPMQTTTPNQYCTNLPNTTVNVTDAPTNATTIAITSGRAHFAPDERTQITVKNIGDYTANNVKMMIPDQFAKYLPTSATTTCGNLLAGASCTFDITMPTNTPLFGLDSGINIRGSNTPALLQTAMIKPSLLQVSPVYFKVIGEAQMTIHNGGQLDISNLSLQDLSQLTHVSGVTLNTDTTKSTCLNYKSATFPSGATCQYDFNVASTAYGGDPISLSFVTHDGINKTIHSSVQVGSARVVINPGSGSSSQPIPVDNTRQGSFQVCNKSNDFVANNVFIKKSNSASAVVLTPSTTNGCTTSALAHLAPGTCCSEDFSFASTQNDNTSVNQGVTAGSDNSSSSSTNLESTSGVTIGVDANDHHLYYRALKVTNNSGSAINFSNISTTVTNSSHSNVEACYVARPSHPEPLSEPCDADFQAAIDASHVTTVYNNCTTVLSLANNASCLLWFKASAQDTFSQGDTATIAASLTYAPATASKHFKKASNSSTITGNFNATYTNLLYIGGNFSSDSLGQCIAVYEGSSSGINNITGWDANVNGEVDAIAGWGGDLYVGGKFTSADGSSDIQHVARWDGSQWNAVDTGVTGDVYALGEWNDDLVVGGHFDTTYTSGSTSTELKNIGAWDGSSWTNLGVGIDSTTDSDDATVYAIKEGAEGNLFVGGNFAVLDGCQNGNASYFAKYYSSDKCFGNSVVPASAIPDVYNTVYSLTYPVTYNPLGSSINAANLTLMLLGGAFTDIDGGGNGTAYKRATYYFAGLNYVVGGNGQYKSSSRSEPYTAFMDGFAGYNGTIYSLYKSDTGSKLLYLGGDYKPLVGGENYISTLEDNLQTQGALKDGLNDAVYAITGLGSNIYMGGAFTKTNDSTTALGGLAIWNGSYFETLGTAGISGATIHALKVQAGLSLSTQS